MPSKVTDEFLEYAGITREYFNDFALNGLRLYNQFRMFDAKKNKEFCECGLLVNSFHIARHRKTKKHAAAMLKKSGL